MIKAAKSVVLITGVSGGIGLATAKIFVAHGWIVVGTVRSRTKGASLRSLQIDLQMADMLKPRDLERVVQNTWRTYGRIDALICNAGYGLIGPIDTLDYARMNEQFTVNTLAPAELIRHTVPLMKRQGFGAIVGVSSIAGRTGIAGYSMYAASKFALEGLLESLMMELAVCNVRVKLIEPSGVDTPFWSQSDRLNGKSVEFSKAHRGLSATTVAKTIYRATIDTSRKLRYPLGQTSWINIAHRVLPERLLLRILQKLTTDR